MNNTDHRAHGAALAIRRIARRAASVLAECNYAQRRLIQLRLSPDSYVYGSEDGPGDYREFLFRTSGVLRREPSAEDRAAGRPCCR